MFSKGCNTNPVDEVQVCIHYLGVRRVPCLINSPLRRDRHPSFNLYSRDNKVYWKDMATGESGNLIGLLSKLWNISYNRTLDRIHQELGECINVTFSGRTKNRKKGNQEIRITIRPWLKKDVEYWKNYGVEIKELMESHVYPILFYFIGVTPYKADSLAYAFMETKGGKVAYKIYQPYSKTAKWRSSFHDDQISLWNRLPRKGKLCVICSSLKDALCLKCNMGIPTIALQGEGYNINDKPLKQLKQRFDNLIVLYDNDEAGLKQSKIFAEKTGVKQVTLPYFKEGKDISDLYKAVGQPLFNSIMLDLFENYMFN